MYSHLVAVEVRVERAASKRMKLDGSAVYEHRLERLNTQSVKSGRTVKKYGVVLNDLFQYVPHVGVSTLGNALCRFGVVRLALCDKLFYDERLEQLERHFLGNAALIELELGTYDDNRTTGVVYALTQKVLTEASLLTAQQARQALELAVGRAVNRLTASAVVDKRVDGFLQHTFFVANDNIGCAEFH